jgi:hypothetical protein
LLPIQKKKKKKKKKTSCTRLVKLMDIFVNHSLS